jgi:hypothetical protein
MSRYYWTEINTEDAELASFGNPNPVHRNRSDRRSMLPFSSPLLHNSVRARRRAWMTIGDQRGSEREWTILSIPVNAKAIVAVAVVNASITRTPAKFGKRDFENDTIRHVSGQRYSV